MYDFQPLQARLTLPASSVQSSSVNPTLAAAVRGSCPAVPAGKLMQYMESMYAQTVHMVHDQSLILAAYPLEAIYVKDSHMMHDQSLTLVA